MVCKNASSTANLAARSKYNAFHFHYHRLARHEERHRKDVTVLKKFLLVSACPLYCSLAFATPLQASFDPGAQYAIVEVSGAPEKLSVITQRTGISGTSYAARQFDCVARTVRFMGSATSLQDLANARPDDEATPIFKGSLSRTISDVACDNALPTPESPIQQRATLSANNL